MNASELRNAVSAFLESDDPVFQQNIDTFIRTSERSIYSAIRTVDSRGSVLGTFSSAQVDSPEDFQDPLQFIVTTTTPYTQLLLKEPSYITEAYGNAVGTPRYYAVLSAGVTPASIVTFLIGPAPDTVYDYELRYIRTPPSIIDVGNTWLGDHAHPALLYGSLLEGGRFLKLADGAAGSEQMKGFTEQYAFAMAALKELCEGVQHMDTYRNPEVRMGRSAA